MVQQPDFMDTNLASLIAEMVTAFVGRLLA